MKSIVVYESRYGNTERLARAVAASLEAAGPVRLVEAAGLTTLDLDGVELLVVGGPTEGHGTSATLRAALERLGSDALGGVAAAAFDTRFRWIRLLTGSAAAGIAKILQENGARLVAPPESFFVKPSYGPLLDGEVERAGDWAKTLAAGLAAATPFVRD
ncbi:MAG TPA: flavodoxin domain-containing protein [Chloroflexota bacterium]